MVKLTNEIFINKANIIHNFLYDYSKTIYINSRDYITIICKIHGEFDQKATTHLKGSGCRLCGISKGHNKQKSSAEDFIKKAKNLHTNKYEYLNIKYVNNKTKVSIHCPNHGFFEQTPNHHLKGKGCKKCANNMKLDLNGFVKKSKIIHQNYYDYSSSIYKNSRTKIIITCKKHGDFYQTPNKHLQGQGCYICNKSKAERKISNILLELGLEFIPQKRFKDCFYKKTLPFDFYIPKYNLCIEYDGEQHYRPYIKFGGEEEFEKTKIKDKIKTNFCQKNNIPLLRISYKDYNKISEIISLYCSMPTPKVD